MSFDNYMSADVKNVCIRNVTSYVENTLAFGLECYYLAQRTIHPEVLPENCPKVVGITFDNIQFAGNTTHHIFERSSSMTKACQSFEITFRNIKGYKRWFRISSNAQGYETLRNKLVLDGVDFRECTTDYDNIIVGQGTDITVVNSIYDKPITFYSDGGTIRSMDCMKPYKNILPSPAKTGDIINSLGSIKVYNGTEWTTFN